MAESALTLYHNVLDSDIFKYLNEYEGTSTLDENE